MKILEIEEHEVSHGILVFGDVLPGELSASSRGRRTAEGPPWTYADQSSWGKLRDSQCEHVGDQSPINLRRLKWRPADGAGGFLVMAAGSSVWADLFNQLPATPTDYPPLDERKYPERFTDDIFRDELPELEFRLEEACVKGSIQEVHDLILKGADKNAPLDKELKTPLMIACQLGWFHLVKWLVEFEGVDLDGPVSRCGFRAIDYAGKEQFRWPNEEVEIADYLRSLGSNYTWWGACFAGDIPRIDEFLQNGQDINEVNPVLWNYNAVDCAIHGGCGKAAQFLVARGGIITVRNCHIPVWEDMLWSLGRGDAFMYKEMGFEEGTFTKL